MQKDFVQQAVENVTSTKEMPNSFVSSEDCGFSGPVFTLNLVNNEPQLCARINWQSEPSPPFLTYFCPVVRAHLTMVLI